MQLQGGGSGEGGEERGGLASVGTEWAPAGFSSGRAAHAQGSLICPLQGWDAPQDERW